MSKLTRREFVHTSTVAGAGLALSGRMAHAVQPNERIGVALIGAGGRGGDHLNGWLRDKRTDVLAIVDVDKSHAAGRADAAEKRQGFRPKIVTDMREVFDDKSIDVISTATPNHWHALCGIWAMQAGKDAYVEKPVSHNIHEGTALIAAARKYNRMCQVGTQCRSATAQQAMVKFIAGGGIGEVNFARGLCYKRRKSIGPLGDYPIPESVNFNLWSGPASYTDPRVTRQKFHYDWHWQRLYGNGDSGNQGPHQTDIARWGLGIDTHPNTVISYGGRLGYQAERKDPNYVDAGDTANTQVSIYDYGDKCIVFETRGLSVDKSDDVELNKLFQSTKGNKIGVVFYGTDGYVVQKSYGHSIAYDADMNVIREFKGMKDHYANFIDACESRDYKDLNADIREGHLSASLAHLGNISFALGEQDKMTIAEAEEHLSKIKSLDDNDATLQRTIQHLKKNSVELEKTPLAMGPFLKFDPENEIFPENEAASALCTRQYREPFVCPTADKV